MATKKGRPTDSVKSYMLRVRMDAKTLEMLDDSCEALMKSRSEVVREGIALIHDRIKE